MYEYTMEGVKLAEVDEGKDIGMTVQKSMKPSKHCKKAAGTASAVLRQLAKNFHYRDKNTLKKLYVQYVRPHLEFASPAWSPWLQEDKEKLERVQMKAIGMISGLTSRSYEEKCKEIGLETLEARRERQDLLEAYKIIHGKNQLDGEKMLTRATERAGVVSRTALDPWKLEIPRSRLETRKNTFAARVPKKWNRLPTNIKASENLLMFKNALKRYSSGT